MTVGELIDWLERFGDRSMLVVCGDGCDPDPYVSDDVRVRVTRAGEVSVEGRVLVL